MDNKVIIQTHTKKVYFSHVDWVIDINEDICIYDSKTLVNKAIFRQNEVKEIITIWQPNKNIIG